MQRNENIFETKLKGILFFKNGTIMFARKITYIKRKRFPVLSVKRMKGLKNRDI